MKAAREYKQLGITTSRYQVILQEMLRCDIRMLYVYAEQVDVFISSYLVESIRDNRSFEQLEARHGVIPCSKTNFYHKRRKLFSKVDKALKEQ